MGRLGQFLHHIGRGIVHVAKLPFAGRMINKLENVGGVINRGVDMLERGLNYYNPYYNINQQGATATENRRAPDMNPRLEAIIRDGPTANLRNMRGRN
jgi:hypothetical protein